MESRIKNFQKKNSRSLKLHQEKILKAILGKNSGSEKYTWKNPGTEGKISHSQNFHEKFLQPKFSQKISGMEILSGKIFFSRKSS